MSDNITNNNSIATNNFFQECIDLAIDGFLFRGITPSDHYYRFSQSFPRALLLSSSFPTTFKHSSNYPQTKTISSFELSSPEEKFSLTRLSSKLSKSRTSLTNQSSSRNTTGLGDPFKSTPSELNYLQSEVQKMEERLIKHRFKHNRPEKLTEMTIKQITDEKINVQQELLRFEKKYSKPTKSEQKKIVKPLYDYYRQLKRLVENQPEDI